MEEIFLSFLSLKAWFWLEVLASSTWKAQIQHHKLKLKTHQPNHLLTTSTFTNLSDYGRINHPVVQKNHIQLPHSKLASPIHPKEPKEQKTLPKTNRNQQPPLPRPKALWLQPQSFQARTLPPQPADAPASHRRLLLSQWSKNAAGVKVKSLHYSVQ